MSTTAVDRARTTARPRDEGRAATSRASRDPFFDNAKLLLVTFVVVGHSWTLMDESYVNDRIYNWLYLWHIPAFVLVTGYLSRSFTWSRRHLRRLATNVVIPYFVFEGLLALFRVVVGGEQLERLWLNPHWPMWYLAALAVWRLATPVLTRSRWTLPATVVVSLLGGTISVETIDLNRVLGLLPFFTAGLLMRRHHVAWLHRRAVRLLSLAVLAAGVALAWWIESHLHTEWLYYRRSYAELDFTWVPGMTVRLLVMTAGAAMALAAIAWIPSRRTWFSRLGSASLVVYLFHGFVVLGAEYAGFEDWAQGRESGSLLITTVGAVLLAFALSWRPVARTLTTVVTPDDVVPDLVQASVDSSARRSA